MKKIIVSPKLYVARDWCRDMGIPKGDVTIITPASIDGCRGIRPSDVFAYLYDSTWDFEPSDDHYFIRFCKDLEKYLQTAPP